MQIRKASEKDIPSLCILLDDLFSQEEEFEANREAQIAGLKTIIENEEIGVIFIAWNENENEITAMINLLYTISTALGGRVALLEDMVVSSTSRGLGIGSKLIEYSIKYAKNSGCKRISLLTDAHNCTAQDFYMKHGFEKSSMQSFRKKLL